jgi:hypothetical protein
MCNVGSWCDVWLWDLLHAIIYQVHVAYVAQGVAATVFGEVSHLSTIETRSFRLLLLIILLSQSVCHVVVFGLHEGGIGVGVVALVLSLIVWCSGSRQVHWHLNIVVCWARGGGRIIGWSLLLLLLWPLLVLLGSSSPCSRSELILILSKRVVESSWIGDSLSGPDGFNHLSSFGGVDRFRFVFIVILGEWIPDDLFQYAWG